jgi:hypothetical protein
MACIQKQEIFTSHESIASQEPESTAGYDFSYVWSWTVKRAIFANRPLFVPRQASDRISLDAQAQIWNTLFARMPIETLVHFNQALYCEALHDSHIFMHLFYSLYARNMRAESSALAKI